MEINTFGYFSNIVNFDGVGVVVNLLMIFIICIYTVYAFMMVRQVNLLNKSFHTEVSYVLRSFALGHLLATLLLLLFTVLSIF